MAPGCLCYFYFLVLLSSFFSVFLVFFLTFFITLRCQWLGSSQRHFIARADDMSLFLEGVSWGGRGGGRVSFENQMWICRLALASRTAWKSRYLDKWFHSMWGNHLWLRQWQWLWPKINTDQLFHVFLDWKVTLLLERNGYVSVPGNTLEV